MFEINSKVDNSILVVEDNPTNLRIIQEILKVKYKVFVAPTGSRALAFLEKKIPDLILLDVEMPGMNGYEVIDVLKHNDSYKDIPVIFLTGQEDKDSEEQAFNMGAVDYILKPVSANVLMPKVEIYLELEFYRKRMDQMVKEKTKNLIKQQSFILDVLSGMTSFRDKRVGNYSERITEYMRLLLDNLEIKNHPNYIIDEEYRNNILKFAKLYDIGKAAVPDELLLKPGRLTKEEFEIVKLHTVYGEQMLEGNDNDGEVAKFFEVAREIIGTHHEWWNGTGYPREIKGEEIPISGRLVAIADVYDALISVRPYKRAFSHEEAIEIIIKESGIHFDPILVELSMDVFKEFDK